jgi:hypothetical protein
MEILEKAGGIVPFGTLFHSGGFNLPHPALARIQSARTPVDFGQSHIYGIFIHSINQVH